MKLLTTLVTTLLALSLWAGSNNHDANDQGRDNKPDRQQHDEQPKEKPDHDRDRDPDHGNGKGNDDHHDPRDCDDDRHHHGNPKPPKPPKDSVGVPAVPTGLMAEAVSLFQVNLTWTDNATNELGFKVERSLDGTNYAQIAQVLPNTTRYRDLNRFPDTKYFYRARAFNAKGDSAYSNVARSQTPAPDCELSIIGWGEIYSLNHPMESSRFVAVDVEVSHGLALKADGTITGWVLYSWNGAETAPTNLTDAVAIAAGYGYSLALRRNGTVVGWGLSAEGAEKPPTNLTDVVAIAAGNSHSLALKSDSTVVGWGRDIYGATAAPTNLTGVVAIAAGGNHSLALKSDGTVVGWGLNDSGQATPPADLADVIAIAAGESHSLALKSDGTVVGWGGRTPDTILAPTNATGVTAISAGYESSVALKNDGSLVHWGGDPYLFWNTLNQLRGVTAVSFNGSQFVALTTTPNPPSELGLKVLATNLVSISWLDNSAGHDDTRIERAPLIGEYDAGEWLEIGHVAPGITSFNDTTVTTNAAYWYRIITFNECAVSPWSSSWAQLRIVPPTQPPYLTATAFADKIQLWGSSPVHGVTSFRLERAPDLVGNPGPWTELLTTNISLPGLTFRYDDSGLAVSNTFWYRLRWSNGLGDSPYSEPVRATIVPPLPPEWATARIGAGHRINLQWSFAYPNDQDGFYIERTTDQPGTNTAWTRIATVTPNFYYGNYSDTAVTSNVTYRYRILAFNVLGMSLPSTEVSIAVIAPTPPVLGSAVFANTIKLGWSNFDYPGDIEQFQLERATDMNGAPGPWTAIATILNPNNLSNLEYTDRGLLPDTTYWYRVRASNWAGTSPYSAALRATIVPPQPPYSFYVSMGASNLVNVTWYMPWPADYEGFRIERALDTGDGTRAWSEIGVIITNSVSLISFDDSNALPNQIYFYRVRSFNAAGISDYSSTIDFAAVPPIQPSLFAGQDADRVNLYAQCQQSGVIGFKVERAADNNGLPGDWTQIATLEPAGIYWSFAYRSCTDSNRLPLATYWYRVRAFNWAGDSELSLAQNVTILPPPSPAYLSAKIGGTNQVELSWLPVSSASEYKLERAVNFNGGPGIWVEFPNLASTNFYDGSIIDLLTHAMDPTVAKGNSYSYRIRAFNVVGNSDYSAPANVDIVPPPAPISAQAMSFADRITFIWYADFSNYGNVTGFEVERANDVSGIPGSWSKVANISISNDHFTDSGLSAGTYWYRVRAYNWIGVSTNSTPLQATVVPPQPPYFLSGKIGTNKTVNLEWAMNWPLGSQEGFIVERTSDANTTQTNWTENGSFTASGMYWISYADTNATALTTNWYRVRAYNNVGVSSNSAALEVRVVPPFAPTYLDASPFADQVKLTWYNEYEYYGHVDGFKIERAPDVNGDPGTWTQVGTARYTSTYGSYTDTNRPVNTAWWYRIRAYNWVGDSPYGNTVRTTILPPTAPSSPYIVLGTTNQVELWWSAGWPYDQDGFYIDRAPASGGVPGNWEQIATSATSSYTDTNITANTTNWYRVRAFNVTGVSPYGASGSIAIVSPEPPLNLAGYPDANRVQLSWNQWPGGDSLGFNIERAIDVVGSPGPWTRLATLEGNSYGRYADTGLTADTKYWYRVQAFNWVGVSPFCNSISVTIVPPRAPEYLYATIQNTNMLRLNWSFPYGNAFDVDGYWIERAPDTGGIPGAWVLVTTNADHTRYGYYDDTDVTANTTNWYRVRSYNVVGLSQPSVPLEVRVIPPAPPGYVTASPFADQIRLSWYGNYYNYGWVHGFEIERAENVAGQPGVWSVIGQARGYDYQYADAGLPAGSTYWYRVRAYNWIGAGESSAPVSGTIVAPHAPYSLTALIDTTNTVEVKWEAASPGDQNGYFLERAPDTGGLPGAWSQITVISNFYGFYLDTNITAFTTNWYRVRSFNVVGISPYTSPIQIAITPPPSPGYVTATPFANQVRLSWGSYFYNYGQVTGYKLERAPDAGGVPGGWTQIATKSSVYQTDYTDPNLPINATFWYRVRAYNWIGDGQLTAPTKATITAPAPPNNVFASLGTTNTVALTWYAGYPYDQDFFTVEWTTNTNSASVAWTEIGIVPATNNIYASFSHTNAAAYTTNWYRLRAVNGVGISSASTPVSISTVPPPVPSYLTAYAYENRITLYWPSYSTYGIIGNKIERAPDLGGVPGPWTQIANLSSYYGSYDDLGLTNNGTYWYRVRTYNWIGASPFTTSASATISWFAAPAPAAFISPEPGELQITSLLLTNQDVLITWTGTGGTTNVIEATSQLWEDFAPISANVRLEGVGNVTTNFLDAGALTNSASRFYRIRAVP